MGIRSIGWRSAGRLGAGIAKLLASEGVSIVVHGRNAERAELVAQTIRDSGGTAVVALGDLSNDAGAASVAAVAPEAFGGGIDILVNNAGGASEEVKKSWFDVDVSEWVATYEKNVTAAGRLIHALAPG